MLRCSARCKGKIYWTLVIVVGIISSLDGRTGELMDTFIEILMDTFIEIIIIVLLPLALYTLFLLGIIALYAVLSIINCFT